MSYTGYQAAIWMPQNWSANQPHRGIFIVASEVGVTSCLRRLRPACGDDGPIVSAILA